MTPPAMAIFRCLSRCQNNCPGESVTFASAIEMGAAVSIYYLNRMRGSLQASKMSAMKFPMTSSAVAMTTQSTTR